MTPRNLAKKIAKIANEHKAEGVSVLDLRKLTSFTDYFVICSGNSDRHVQAIASAIHFDLKKEDRIPLGEEGMKAGGWALIDYGDVVAHVFYKEMRDHYQLESLWHDAPRVEVSGV